MKRITIFLFLILSAVFLYGAEDNNPCLHSWGEVLYDCTTSVSGGSVSVPCNTTENSAIAKIKSASTKNGSCLRYQLCSKCGARNDIGENTFSGPVCGALNCTTDPGGHIEGGGSCEVSASCHTKRTSRGYVSVGSHSYYLMTDKEHTLEYKCYMTARLLYDKRTVSLKSFNAPLGSGFSFNVTWNNPAPDGVTNGRNEYETKSCKTCGNKCTWGTSRMTASHTVERPAPTSTGTSFSSTYGYGFSFPSTGKNSVTFIKECKSREASFQPHWDQTTTVGGCDPGKYEFTVNSVGVKSLDYNPKTGKVYVGENNEIYVLSEIKEGEEAAMGNSARPAVPIIFIAAPEGGAWPSVDPYLGGISDDDLTDGEKAAKNDYKYPHWSCSAPQGATQPLSYEFTGEKGSSSATFKGKSQGNYSVSVNCGTDSNPDKDPEDNLGTRIRKIHVCNPRATANFGIEKNEEGRKEVKDLAACDERFIPFTFSATPGGAPVTGKATIKINAPSKSYELYVIKDGSYVEAGGGDMVIDVAAGESSKTIYLMPVKHERKIKRTGYTITVEYVIGSTLFRADPQSDSFTVLWKDTCTSGSCSVDGPDVENGSIQAQFPLGSGNWGASGGAWDVYAEKLNYRLLNNQRIEVPRSTTNPNEDTMPTVIEPMLNFTYGDGTAAKVATEADALSDSTRVAGYPIRVRTGKECTEFEYEQATVGTFTFVSKIIARQYLSSGTDVEEAIASGTTPISVTTVQLIYNPTLPGGENPEPEVTAFNISYVQYSGTSTTEKSWQFTNTPQVCPDLDGDYTISHLVQNGVNNILVKKEYQENDISYRREIRYIGSMTNPVNKEDQLYRQYDWGEELISETINGDTTTYEFVTSGNGFGKLYKVTYPRGNQITYTYNSANELASESELRGSLTYATTYEYTYNSTQKSITTLAIQKVGETVVRKTKTVTHNSGISSNPDETIEYDEADNEYVTKTWYTQGPDGQYDKRISRQENPDGTTAVYSYNRSGNLETTTVESGIFSGNTLQKGTRQISVSNKNGSSVSETTYFIDAANNISQKISETVNTAFDSFGRPTTTTYLDGSSVTRVYGCCGIESETDRDGITTTYAYDNFSRVSYTVRDGITTLYTYDDAGNVLSTTIKGRDNGEITTSSTYTLGKVATSTDTLGNVTTYAYTATADTVTKPDGSTEITTYQNGEETGKSGTAVHPVTYEFGANWQKELPKNITTHTNMRGQVSKIVYGDNTYQENFYNSKNLLVKSVSPAGRIVLYEYDDLNRQIKQAVDMNLNGTIDDADLVTETAYTWGTRDNKPVSVTTVTIRQGTNATVNSIQEQTVDKLESWVTDARGLTTYKKKERLGQGSVKDTEQRADGSKTVTTTQNGRVVKVETFAADGAAENVVDYTCDEFNFTASETVKTGSTVLNSITYTYDALGRQLSRTVNGQTTSMSYNDMLRTNTTTLPGGRVMTETFYPTGERKRLSGSDTYTQEWSWNSTWETKASLTTWKTDSTPQTTSWSYDVRGNLISKTYPDNSGPVYTYDADGKLLTRTWSRQANGQPLVTTFTYDNAGRSTGYSYSDGTTASVSFTNDYLGRKESVTDASGTHEFSYGTNTLLASVSSPVVANASVSYSYDAYRRKTGMQVSVNGQSGTRASYSYDTNGRLSSLGNGSRTLHYSYLPGTSYVSSRQWKDTNDASHQTLNYTYDSQHRLTSVKLGTAPEVSYTLNAKNQRVQTSFGDGSYWDYSYDDKGQITGAVKRDADGTALAGMQYGYVYDGIGNRASAEEGSSANAVSYSSNQLNQYTAINTALPTYDADGNLLTTGNGWSYTYNGENRLIQAENSDTRLEFTYDYTGRRFEKKVYTKGILSLYSWSLSKHYRYIYDDYKLVEIRDANDGNALLKSFVWQPADAGQDVPLSMSYDGSTYYYIVDGNKNVTGLQDESGNRVATYMYGPFGQLLSMDGGLAEENPLRFSSEYFDDETGLVYYNYRYYSPQMGRWINRDPIEEEGGVNLYQILSNNAINKVDYLGMDDDCCGGKKLSSDECCHNDSAMKLSVDIKKEGKKCCVKLVKICITSHGLHQNICIGMNCYSFGIRDDLSYWAALVSRYFNSGETYVDIPGKEEKCFKVKKSIADSLKNSMDLQVGQRSPYHVTNIGTWGNNCRAYSQVLYNEFSSNEYSGNLPECSNNDSNTRNSSPRK